MSTPLERRDAPLDLLDLPLLGRFLGWRHARTALGLPLLLLAGLVVFDGLAGPQMAPKNLATVLVWVHYRGAVVLALLLVGNLFCLACPFMLVRNGLRRFVHPRRVWPRRLRTKWAALGLLAGLLFAYEYFDLWATPLWTAWLVLAYFAGALVVDGFFRGATFCKYLCPLGQFNFLASALSPFEICVRDAGTCAACPGKECIAGRAQPGTRLPGCQLWLYQPGKVGNVDCTFCLDCAHACPYDNVGFTTRLPAAELWAGGRRSGIGRLTHRPDLAALVTVFAFGALLNAFAMVTPVYALQDWLAGLLGTRSEFPVLAILYVAGLILLPGLLLAATAWASRRLARPAPGPTAPGPWLIRFTYALLPLGLGVWLAHYTFHFLTGFWTVVPVIQSFVADLAGVPLLGTPRWDLGPLVPAAWLYPLELGFLGLGWFGSLLVAQRIAQRLAGPRAWHAWLPWAILLALLLAAAIWLMGQPMEMRGTFMVG